MSTTPIQVKHPDTDYWHKPDCPALAQPGDQHDCECPEFLFYDINPFIEAGSGEAFYFLWHGDAYFVECWSTHNSAGQDIYEVDSGSPATLWSDNDTEARWEQALEEVSNAWFIAWGKHVTPVIDKAKEEALSGS